MAALNAQARHEPQQEMSLLTRSVEKILRNLIRLLVGKLSLVRVQEVIREIFVQEAEAKLRAERPGRNVALSRLALLTGLDTRTVTRVREELSSRKTLSDEEAWSRDTGVEARVVELWSLNPACCDADSGEPRPLTYGEAESEFEDLIRQATPSRGITSHSVLERLVATNTVAVDRKAGRVSLITKRYTPFNSDHEMSLMMSGMQAVGNLTETVHRNITSPRNDRHVQREVWTFRLDPARQAEFQAAVRQFLLDMEARADDVMSPLEAEYDAPEQLTAGVGFYYFEE